MHRLRLLATSLIVCGLAVAGPEKVNAGADDPGTASADSTPDGQIRAVRVLRPEFGSSVRQGDGGGGDPVRPNPGCGWFPAPPDTFVETTKVIDGVVHDVYVGMCAADGLSVAAAFWIPRLTATDLLPGARDEATSQIPAPAVEFMNLDPTHGWAYATVPQDFRITNLEPVSASASVSAGPVWAWVTVTATPTRVVFDPGEPRGRPVECSPDAAQAPFVVDSPGACSYSYKDSSAMATNRRSFDTSATVEWEISYRGSSGSGSLDSFSASTTEALGVAEIQAVVTCMGEHCG